MSLYITYFILNICSYLLIVSLYGKNFHYFGLVDFIEYFVINLFFFYSVFLFIYKIVKMCNEEKNSIFKVNQYVYVYNFGKENFYGKIIKTKYNFGANNLVYYIKVDENYIHKVADSYITHININTMYYDVFEEKKKQYEDRINNIKKILK